MDVAAFLAVLAATLAFGAWLIVHEEDDEQFTYRFPLDSSARAARDPGAADDSEAAPPPPPGRRGLAPSDSPAPAPSQPAQRAPGPYRT